MVFVLGVCVGSTEKKWGSPGSVKAEILFYHVSKLFHSEVFLSLALNISESY